VAEAVEDVGAELVDVEVGGVDERVGDVADGIEELALFDDGAPDGFRAAEGVGAARFRVAADENGVLRVEKDDAGGSSLLDALEDFRQAVESGPRGRPRRWRRARLRWICRTRAANFGSKLEG
jgi:hypothetical protein